MVKKISEEGKRALDALVKEIEAEGSIPGFVVAVSNTSEQLYTSAGGCVVHDDPASARVSAEETVFWLCSMGKVITSIAGLQLVERGLLNLSDPITKYLPSFSPPKTVVIQGLFQPDVKPTCTPAKSTPTVGSVFNHTSGLSYFTSALEYEERWGLWRGYTEDYYKGEGEVGEGEGEKEGEGDRGRERFLELLKEGWPGIPLAHEPETEGFAYGYSTDVLGVVVELVTGQSLADYCAENIFKPLGLTSLTFELTEELHARLLPITFRNKAANGAIERWDNHTKLIQRFPDQVVRAHGGIGAYGTLPDFAALLRHVLQLQAGGTPDRPPLLKSRSSIQALFEPTLSASASASLGALAHMLEGDPETLVPGGMNHSRAFGLVTRDWPGRRRAGTGYWSGWAGMHYIVDPATGIAIVAGTQVVPTMDAGSTRLFRRVEEVVYAHLEDE